MPEEHRFAVLFALDPLSPTPGGAGPSQARLRHVLDTGPNSVRQFWADNVPYVHVDMTIFDRVTINPDRTPLSNGAPRPRGDLIAATVNIASQIRGFNRAAFDHVFVVVHGGDGFEWGATNGDAVVRTDNDFSTICHEFGHCLGFDHSRGFVHNVGGIWTDDYGSPYDVMAMPSGNYRLLEPDQLPPGDTLAGPMIARAIIFYDKPNALRETGKALETNLSDAPISEDVWAAGRSGPGQPELLVFYTEGVRDAKHQLMVEYRQPDRSVPGPSHWDRALDGPPSQGNTPGVVVYTVKTARWPDGRDAFDRPYYSGTVSLAAGDYDVEVAFPWGSYTIALASPPPRGGDPDPDHVRVTVGRAPLGAAKVRITAEHGEIKETHGTEMRVPPNLPPLWGPQEYNISRTLTTWTLSAQTFNVGGLSSLRQAEDSTLEWTVDGVEIPADGTVRSLRGGLVTAQVAMGTRVLTVRNPSGLADPAVVLAKVQAWDLGAGAHLTSEYEMTFEGETAEPGETLQRLLAWYDLKFNRRFPIPRPPNLLDLQRLRYAYRQLEETDPRLAALAKPLMDQEEAAWRDQLAEIAWQLQELQLPHQ